MNHLLSLREVCVQYGQDIVLDHAQLALSEGDKLALVGRNGAGKSTLLSIITGDQAPDEGEVRRNESLRIVDLPQHPARPNGGTVGQFLMSSLADDIEEWDRQRRIERMASALDFEVGQEVVHLSGGQWRRVMLALTLMADADVLLLDEPTNHLDISSIEWLEGYLKATNSAVIFTSHDRAFTQSVARGVLDLDRGTLKRWDETYVGYVERKEQALADEARHDEAFDKKLAEEEKWIRKGIQARRTRNMGRVRQLQKMRQQHSERRSRMGTVEIAGKKLDKKTRSAKRVLVAEEASLIIDDKGIVDNFSTVIERGDRIGIIGPNGSGKTTLVQMLLGERAPTAGTVELGMGVEIAYFDQHRTQLDENLTALENVAQGREFIEVNGKNVHIMSYMQQFLFLPERARAPIDKLSGGERHRLLLARLLSTPFNFLVMDEPTNDLDVETLELLEDWISHFDGTLIVISHDRAFLDNTVTHIWASDGQGRFDESIGGYSDYLAKSDLPQKANKSSAEANTTSNNTQLGTRTEKKTVSAKKKLSYKDQRELDLMPERIETLEQRVATLTEITLESDFYNQNEAIIKKHMQELSGAQSELDGALARWEELES